MKKKIMSFVCALVMIIAAAEPAFAADSETLYTQFKNASLTELRNCFIDNFGSFDVSHDGNTYTDSQKSLIILDAWQRGFDSFEELNSNTTRAAQSLADKKNNPTLVGLSGYSNVNLSFDPPEKTSPKDVFKIGNAEFIVLDSVPGEDGEQQFFVMAKDYYGTVALDPDNLGRWDDFYYKLLPYKLTNQMAFGNYPTYNLPTEILKHIDVLHEWNVEPGSGAGYTAENVLVAPISVISATEYLKYGEKIGLDRESGLYWTRTPVLGDSVSHFTVNTAAPKIFSKNKGWGGNYLRPVFYLKGSFFRQEKMEKCGENVAAYLDAMLDESDIAALYSEDEIESVFGSLSVVPGEIKGNAVVGETLTVDYTYDGKIALTDVEIVWMRSADKTDWQQIPGAVGKSYRLTDEDAGHFIRAEFYPKFDSVIFKNGRRTYAEKQDAVFTDSGIAAAVKEVDAASDTKTLRALLEKYEPLFHCDYTEEKFPEGAAKIFINDSVSTVSEVVDLYNGAIALDEFAAAAENAREKAESRYLLGSIPEYEKLKTEQQKDSVVLSLSALDAGKEKLSAFIEKAKELIMLERFNNAERGDIVALIKEYASALGVDISGLTNYQIETAGTYVVGTDYGRDIARLKAAVAEGIGRAKNTSSPSKPTEDKTKDYPSGGFISPVTQKPEPAQDLPESAFSDLQSTQWAAAAINALAGKGILQGNGDGTFSPDRPVTRNEFVKMIVTAFDVPMSDEELHYEDIEKNSWSEKFIAAAVGAGIISGISESLFGDGRNITRQDAAVIAERVMRYKGAELKSSSLNFDDSYEISDYAVDAVAKMNYSGIMSGVSDSAFAPKDSTTRAMAAVVVYNLMNYYENRAADDSPEVVRTSDKYNIVYRIGILREEFLKDAKITRGELAAALTAFGNYGGIAGEGIFDDVTAQSPYYADITAVYKNNIMAGRTENLFMPDESATYKEAYDAVIAAAGYAGGGFGSDGAERTIGKETGYAQGGELTPEMAEKLFYAALEIQVTEISGTDTVKLSKNNILNTNFRVYKEKGIVTGASGVSIGGRGEYGEDKIIVTVNSEDFLYSADGCDYSEYLGCEVTYYYRENDDGYSIVDMLPANPDRLPMKLSFDMITSAEKDLSAITYKRENRIKQAKISKSANFIYNGKRCYSVSVGDLTPDNGYITLIDTDNNGTYDVVKIDRYEYIMVAQIDAQNKSVMDRFTWRVYGFDEDKDAEKINITKNGRTIKLEHLDRGDVLAIAKSRDGELINAYVSDKKISGRVQAVSPEEYEIEIGGNVLSCVHNFDFAGLSGNVNVVVGLDWNGFAVGYYTEADDAGVRYGYLYRISENDNEELVFGLLTQDNEYAALTQSEKLIANGAAAEKSDVRSLLSYDPATGTIEPQLVAYSTDDEGRVKRLFTAKNRGSAGEPLVLNKKFAADAPEVVYNSFGMTLDFEYNLPAGGIMFDITLDGGKPDKESSYVTSIAAQVIPQNTKPEKLYVYNADESRVSELCVYEHMPQGGNEGYKEGFSTQAFVISKVIEKYDEENSELVTVFGGYHSGAEVEYRFSDKLKGEVDSSKIAPGDVLLVWMSGDKITRFRRLYSESEKNAFAGETGLLCNYGDHNYTGESIVRGGTNYDYAYDWAQHIIERAEGKSGSTTVAATRWASLYGDVELIYKDELYAYPIVKLKVAGKSEPASYTLDANTRLYRYNRVSHVIEPASDDSLNASAKKAVLTARYGNVRDVIIYED